MKCKFQQKLYNIIAFTCVFLVLLTLIGCSNDDDIAKPVSKNAIDFEFSESIPLNDELKLLYEQAKDVCVWFEIYPFFGDKGYEFADDSNECVFNGVEYNYYRVNDTKFETFEEFNEYLLQIFTNDFADTLFPKDNQLPPIYVNNNNKIYALDGGRGTNIYYSHSEYAVKEQSDNKITLIERYWFEDNIEEIDGTVYKDGMYQDSTNVFIKVNGEWRVDDFELLL